MSKQRTPKPVRKSMRLGLDLDILPDLQIALSHCAQLGAQEEAANVTHHPTAGQLITWLGCRSARRGYIRVLRAAYEAGRFATRMAQVVD